MATAEIHDVCCVPAFRRSLCTLFFTVPFVARMYKALFENTLLLGGCLYLVVFVVGLAVLPAGGVLQHRIVL